MQQPVDHQMSEYPPEAVTQDAGTIVERQSKDPDSISYQSAQMQQQFHLSSKPQLSSQDVRNPGLTGQNTSQGEGLGTNDSQSAMQTKMRQRSLQSASLTGNKMTSNFLSQSPGVKQKLDFNVQIKFVNPDFQVDNTENTTSEV